MCHDWWMRHERRREERLDEELRYLLDERGHSDPGTPGKTRLLLEFVLKAGPGISLTEHIVLVARTRSA